MADMKTLAKDTAIYGLSSIIGRFLNYLLGVAYTYIFPASSGAMGVNTNIYAYTGLALVILTYGMETTFFRFANKEGEKPELVYSTVLRMIGTTSLLFIALMFAFIGPISSGMGYQDHPSYVWVMAIVVALDAFQAILFSYLRYQKRPIKFASLKILFIVLSITLNLVYFVLLPKLHASNPSLWGKVYNPEIGVGYVFYINLFCTSVITFFFAKELKGIGYGFDKDLCKRMLSYSWPILVLGIAGILNQTADKILFPKVYPGEDANVQLGIYGSAVKIAMIMAMITQAFRYAYEPMVFGDNREKNAKETQAKGMKFFIIFTLLAFLFVMGYINVLRYIIQRDYWEGLKVVPIVMAAEMMMGIYFNLSFWYKLEDKTLWGAVFSGIGCAVLIAINILLIPRYGYMACAWGGVAGYGTAMLLSYFVGKKKSEDPVDYPMKDLSLYTLLAAVLFVGITFSNKYLSFWPAILVNTLLVLVFCAYIVKKDLPLSEIPVVGKYFKK
ncbi:MAG: lipopolysaccharide biosynthesis protein [Bacteroidales bacterium]|nr:lipopolysaccharide biosynthesis protein [Bacteroidales bacterium]